MGQPERGAKPQQYYCTTRGRAAPHIRWQSQGILDEDFSHMATSLLNFFRSNATRCVIVRSFVDRSAASPKNDHKGHTKRHKCCAGSSPSTKLYNYLPSSAVLSGYLTSPGGVISNFGLAFLEACITCPTKIHAELLPGAVVCELLSVAVSPHNYPNRFAVSLLAPNPVGNNVSALFRFENRHHYILPAAADLFFITHPHYRAHPQRSRPDSAAETTAQFA